MADPRHVEARLGLAEKRIEELEATVRGLSNADAERKLADKPEQADKAPAPAAPPQAPQTAPVPAVAPGSQANSPAHR